MREGGRGGGKEGGREGRREGDPPLPFHYACSEMCKNDRLVLHVRSNKDKKYREYF